MTLASPPSPCVTSGFALEGPRQIGRDPTTVEPSRLRGGRKPAHGALEAVRIERHAPSQRFSAGHGVRVAPGVRGQLIVAVEQAPVAGRAFPLAKRAAWRWLEQMPRDVIPRDVISRWMRRLQHAHAARAAGNLHCAPDDAHLTRLRCKARRPREVPDRGLAWTRLRSEARPCLPTPVPLFARGLQPGRWPAGSHIALSTAEGVA